MWSYLHNAYKDSLSWALSLNKSEWMLVMIVVVAVGFICLRGFGSRKDY